MIGLNVTDGGSNTIIGGGNRERSGSQVPKQECQ